MMQLMLSIRLILLTLFGYISWLRQCNDGYYSRVIEIKLLDVFKSTRSTKGTKGSKSTNKVLRPCFRTHRTFCTPSTLRTFKNLLQRNKRFIASSYSACFAQAFKESIAYRMYPGCFIGMFYPDIIIGIAKHLFAFLISFPQYRS